MRRRRPIEPAPDEVFDDGLQQERTVLAWERTAFSIIVVGSVLGRYAASDGFYIQAAFGGCMVAVGVGLLIWSARRYSELHEPLRAGESPVHPFATRLVGVVTTGGSLLALLIAIRLIGAEWFG